MIFGMLHQGSGVGNQLFRYIATRIKAKELGTDWRMIYNPDGSGKKEGFKADDFIKFDYAKLLPSAPSGLNVYQEKKVVENETDIRSYDPEFNFIDDNTIIDGEFQDERYWMKHKKDVDSWLFTEPVLTTDDTCVIGFRGGEFTLFPNLFLAKDYWQAAIEKMQKINPGMRFEVHTDDPQAAREMFGPILGDIRITRQADINWRTMRFAKYAIIANSSFFIFPRWLRHRTGDALTVSPRFWARRNTKTWCLPQNFYSCFSYI